MVVLLAGSTAHTPARFALVAAASTVGTFTGELAGYTIGRTLGSRLRTGRIGRLIGPDRWDRAEAYLSGTGGRVLVPIRFVSMLHAVAPIVAGSVRMPLRRFAGWAGLGAAVWALVYVAVGAAAGTAYRQYGHLGLGLSVLVLAGAAVLLGVRSRLRARRARKAAEESAVRVTAATDPATTDPAGAAPNLSGTSSAATPGEGSASYPAEPPAPAGDPDETAAAARAVAGQTGGRGGIRSGRR
ncbi:DedA family protein [Micromonospora zhanjiangensis]